MSINGHDKTKEGSTDIAIGIHEGKVLIHWHQPTTHILFEPQNAFEFGEQMARTAHKARFGEEAPSDGKYLAGEIRARLTEEMRDRLSFRVMHVIRSLTERHKTPQEVAKEVIQVIFNEVA